MEIKSKGMTTYKSYKEKIKIAVDVIFEGISDDVTNIIDYAECAQGKEDTQDILDTVVADLKGLLRELKK